MDDELVDIGFFWVVLYFRVCVMFFVGVVEMFWLLFGWMDDIGLVLLLCLVLCLFLCVWGVWEFVFLEFCLDMFCCFGGFLFIIFVIVWVILLDSIFIFVLFRFLFCNFKVDWFFVGDWWWLWDFLIFLLFCFFGVLMLFLIFFMWGNRYWFLCFFFLGVVVFDFFFGVIVLVLFLLELWYVFDIEFNGFCDGVKFLLLFM